MKPAFLKTTPGNLFLAGAVLLFFSGCQKETVRTSSPSSQSAQNTITGTSKTREYINRMRANMQRRSDLLNSQLKNNRAQMASILQQAGVITTKRLLMKNGSGAVTGESVTSGANASHKNVVNVPGDFSNLQDAVNYFSNFPGGKILIKGTITIHADVAVDVSNLSIQGVGAAATINGTNLSAIQFLATGIEFSNLNVNVNLVINGVASGANLHDNNISTTDSTGTNMLIAIHGASNCSINNSTILEGATANNSTAIFSDGSCTGNAFKNDKFLNFKVGLLNYDPPFGSFYSAGTVLQMMGDINPWVQNCTFDNNVNGIDLLGCTNATIENDILTVTPNSLSSGIVDQPVTDASGNIITVCKGTHIKNCAINPKVTSYNAPFGALSIGLTSSVNPTISDCSAIYAQNGVSLLQCTNATVTNCFFNFNETGISDGGSTGTTVNNITSSHNQFFGVLAVEDATFLPPDYIYASIMPEARSIFENTNCNFNGLDGVTLQGTSSCTVKNCTANNNTRWGITVDQVTIALNISPYDQYVIVPSINNIITGNTAKNNMAFDYQQTISTNITFTKNNFGTTSIN